MVSRPLAPARPDLAAVVGPTRVVAPLLAAATLIAVVAVSVSDLGLSTAVASTLIVLATIVAGALARHSLAGVAVGAVLRLARPYADGERVRIWLPALDADVQAELVHIGVANTSLRTSVGELLVPNTLLVQAPPHHTPESGAVPH